MWKFLSLLKQNLIWSVPSFMIAGIIFGSIFDPSFLKATIIPLTFLMVYPMMINLQIAKVFGGGDLKLQGITQLINFAVVPFFAFGIGKLFFGDQPLILLGLLLTSLLPTSGMTISWTGFAKGNLNAAIKMTVIGLIAGSLATPLYAKYLMGAVVEIPLVDVFKQIVIIVFLPMILGFVTKQILIKTVGESKYNKNLKQKFPVFSTIGVLGIVFVAMALKSKSIVENPVTILSFFVPLIIIYGFNFGLSTLIGKALFNREDAIALVYGTVMRNLSIALAIAMTVFGPEGSEIALIIAMGYIIQVQSAAWYVKLTDTIFGPPSDESQTSPQASPQTVSPASAKLQPSVSSAIESELPSPIKIGSIVALVAVVVSTLAGTFMASRNPSSSSADAESEAPFASSEPAPQMVSTPPVVSDETAVDRREIEATPAPTPGAAVAKATDTVPDTVDLEELNQIVYKHIDNAWTRLGTAVTAEVSYVITVTPDGAIADYEPLSADASDNVENTPLPSLVESDSIFVKTGDRTVKFEAIFTDTGTLEVKPSRP